MGERKVAAVGVRISHGVSTHGIALNVATDLAYFRRIVPCGTPDKEVTSLLRELGPGACPPLQRVAESFLDTFATHFGYSTMEGLPDVNALAAAEEAAAAAAAAKGEGGAGG